MSALRDFSLSRKWLTALGDEVAMRDGVIVDDFIARGKDKDLLLIIHLLPLCDQHLDVGERLRTGYLASFIAQKCSAETVTDALRALEDDPVGRRLSLEFNIVDRRPVLLAVDDLEKGARGEVNGLGIELGFLGGLSEKFKTGDPFLF